MHPQPPDRHEISFLVAPSRIWRTTSLIVFAAAVVCSAILLFSRSAEPGIILSGISLAVLGIIAALLAQSAYLTRSAVRSAGGTLERRERELNAVFDGAMDAILILDRQEKCRFANSAALRLLGVRPEQLVGQPIAAFCVDPNETPIRQALCGAGHRDHGQAEMMRADGANLTVEYTVSGFFVSDRHLVVLRDITARQCAEEAKSRSLDLARSALREAHALRRGTLALARELRLNPLLDTLLRTLHALVPYETAQIFLVETGARLFLAREAHNDAQESRLLVGTEILDASEYPVLGAVLRSGKAKLISDTASRKDWRDLPMGISVRSWAGVPLEASEQVIGCLAVAHTLPGQFLPEHLRIAESLAISAAVAIQNARLYERAEIYAEELERRLSDLRCAEQALAQSEEERRTSEESLQKVFRFAPVALSVTALEDGRFLEVNEAFERRFGYQREELIGRTSTELGLWPNSDERTVLANSLREGKHIHAAITRFRVRSGEVQCFLYSAEMIHLYGQQCVLLACDHPPDFDPRSCN